MVAKTAMVILNTIIRLGNSTLKVRSLSCLNTCMIKYPVSVSPPHFGLHDTVLVLVLCK